MGVARGPLRQRRFSRMEARVSSGSGAPWRGMAPAPASRGSQAISAPVASTARTAASTTSGPIPSPLINVTLVDMAKPCQYTVARGCAGEPGSPEHPSREGPGTFPGSPVESNFMTSSAKDAFARQSLLFLDWPDVLARLAEQAQSARGAEACRVLPLAATSEEARGQAADLAEMVALLRAEENLVGLAFPEI